QLRRDPQLVRRHVTGSLEDSVVRFGKHKRPEIIESFLLLAGRDNATLMQILLDPLHAAFVAMIQMLTHSTRPGVMRLVLSHLDNSQAPTSLVSVLSHRSDKRFVEHLLRKIGHTPSAGAKANLKRVESIAWLKGSIALLDELDDAGQHSAAQMVLASRMKSADAYGVIEHLALHGNVGGRRAAVAGLPRFTGTEANQLALQTLKDSDPQVQALALGQLRQRGIPGALPILLSHIDSPHHLVRQAARDSLAEFGFPRFLAAFDLLEEDVARCTGILVKRIDVNTVPLLRQEMQSSSGKRRLRALDVARVIEVVPQIEETIIELARQEDHLVRTAAAAALAASDTSAARTILEEARSDSSLAVQEAALASLAEIDRRARLPRPAPKNTAHDSSCEAQP
ncbi:MAG TPA: HEAT repeat domain-containing protein, partial [Pirellulales bacterium]|nr:HEAT repeat domain-containing protein [Pirellulales bacterium]